MHRIRMVFNEVNGLSMTNGVIPLRSFPDDFGIDGEFNYFSSGFDVTPTDHILIYKFWV